MWGREECSVNLIASENSHLSYDSPANSGKSKTHNLVGSCLCSTERALIIQLNLDDTSQFVGCVMCCFWRHQAKHWSWGCFLFTAVSMLSRAAVNGVMKVEWRSFRIVVTYIILQACNIVLQWISREEDGGVNPPIESQVSSASVKSLYQLIFGRIIITVSPWFLPTTEVSMQKSCNSLYCYSCVPNTNLMLGLVPCFLGRRLFRLRLCSRLLL